MAEAQTEATYGFRQAFRSHDGSNAGPSMKFPLREEDFEGDMVEIPEGSEYPRASMSYGEVEAVYTKYGFEFPISDEAVADGVLPIRMDAMSEMMREEARRLDQIAYNVVAAQNNAATGGNADGVLTFDELVDARAEHRSQEFDPDLLLVEALGAADILKDDTFKLRDTPVGDRAVTNGFIGSVAGVDIFEANSTPLGAHDAYLVDTSLYGYESSKEGENGVSSYREESNDQEVYKIKDRLDWVATNPDAALYIDG
ncbi:phage major capsid protein [Halomarina pelagica]|uniref:phage major capsid protein n=1 Tax=Halomarina pelagica TaxID=2961599 RepID=UPI0020C3773D|nr:hypothetical protein [Halomarina sp. BND7]